MVRPSVDVRVLLRAAAPPARPLGRAAQLAGYDADWTLSQVAGALIMNIVPEPGPRACSGTSLGSFLLFRRQKNMNRANAEGRLR